MQATIDRAGRIVLPKPLRDALGLQADDELEITEVDGRLIIERPPVAKRVEATADGPVLVADRPVPPLDPATVRRAIEQSRR